MQSCGNNQVKLLTYLIVTFCLFVIFIWLAFLFHKYN